MRFIMGLFAIMFTCNVAQATTSQEQMITIFSIAEAASYFDQLDEHALVIFDVDSTLTVPSDLYLRRHAIHRHRNIYDQFKGPLTKNQKRIFDHVLVSQSPSQLVEQEFPLVIKKLQQRKVITLAFTAAKTGPLGNIVSSFPEWRYQELKRLGIDFAAAFPGEVLFKDFRDYGNDRLGMAKGIVYSGHKYSKGEILPAALEQLKWTPRKIVFIDDKVNNLRSIAAGVTALNKNIEFLGIHYQAIEMLSNPTTTAKVFAAKIAAITKKTKRICAE